MNNRSGGLMITTVATMAAIAVLGTAIVAMTRISSQRGLQHNHDERAYYMAQAGLAYARTIAATNVEYASPTTFQVGSDGIFELVLTNFSTNAYATVVGKAGVGTPWEAHYRLGASGGGGIRIAMAIPEPPPPPPPEPPPPTPPTPETPPTNIVDNMVFVYGTELKTGGGDVTGDNATIVVDQNLMARQLGNSDISVSYIYVGSNIFLLKDQGSIGSSNAPGAIYVGGSVRLRGREGRTVYGDLYVGGDFWASHGVPIYGNVYVQGSVVLFQQGVWLADDKYIYYRGENRFQNNVPQWVRDRCIQTDDVPTYEKPNLGTLVLRSPEWYDERGYVHSTTLANDSKIYATTDITAIAALSATNVIIAGVGDITVTASGDLLTGVIYAPSGQVVFNGARFEGTVIARDGFEAGNNADVKFVGIDQYIASTNDYPFEVQ
jgi:hypothetical protein